MSDPPSPESNAEASDPEVPAPEPSVEPAEGGVLSSPADPVREADTSSGDEAAEAATDVAGEAAGSSEASSASVDSAPSPPEDQPEGLTPSGDEPEASEAPGLGMPLVPLVALLALWAFAFGGGVADMVGHWLAPQSYYGHGPLVPVVVAWMLWRDRATLAQVARAPSYGGLWLLVPALLVTAVGHLEDIKVLQNLSLLLSLYGMAWCLFGRRALLRAWVPALFLIFMVPLPGFVIDRMTFGLKMLAAKLSVLSIHAAGIPAILDGGTIHLAETDVLVDDVCSGLKTMVALIGFSVVFAYLQATRLKAALILVLAVPVSIVANVIRILILCWFAAVGNAAAFEGPLHEATGLLVYVLALVLFLLAQALPLPGDPSKDDDAPEVAAPPPAPPAPVPPERGHWGALFGVAGVGLLLLVLSLLTAAGGATEATQVTARIPATVGPWESTRVLLTEDVYRVLGTRDAMFRRYSRAATTTTVDLYVTYAAGDIFRVAHPPERCFAGGGFTEQARRIVQIQLGDRTLSVNRIVFRRDIETVLVYYWYRLNGKDVAEYTQYRFGSLLRRVQRYDSSGSMIRLSTVIDNRGEAAAQARLDRYVAEALPAALAPIGD